MNKAKDTIIEATSFISNATKNGMDFVKKNITKNIADNIQEIR